MLFLKNIQKVIPSHTLKEIEEMLKLCSFTQSSTFIDAAIFEWSKSDRFDVANASYTPQVFPGA
jgi:hypothetical protein